MPSISSYYGIIIYMYFNEHNPPHFNVIYNEYKAVISINDGAITGSLPRRALNMVYEWLDIHKDELLHNWEIMKDGIQPQKIEGLK